jgi:hypothetical protein
VDSDVINELLHWSGTVEQQLRAVGHVVRLCMDFRKTHDSGG